MNAEELINRLQAFKKYLTDGNPIWDKDEVAEVFDSAIDSIEAWIKVGKLLGLTERGDEK